MPIQSKSKTIVFLKPPRARIVRARERIAAWLGSRGSWRRATAAVEFAVASPLFVLALGGSADYGLAQFYRANLSNAVAAGSEYAYFQGTTVSTSNITSVVTNVMNLPAGASSNLAVNYTSAPATSGPGWYCLSVSAGVTTLTSSTSGGSCTSDGSTTTAGYYVTISATYTNTGLMHGFMSTVSQPITETATVRLK
jgi:Flp pilus assembly protein TadG